MTLDCSRVAEEIAMVSGVFVEGRRQTLLYSCISDKNKKDHKNLQSKVNWSIIARDRTTTKQGTLKQETNKTDRNPPITNHKPSPCELVEVNMFPKRSAKMIDGTEKPNVCKQTA